MRLILDKMFREDLSDMISRRDLNEQKLTGFQGVKIVNSREIIKQKIRVVIVKTRKLRFIPGSI